MKRARLLVILFVALSFSSGCTYNFDPSICYSGHPCQEYGGGFLVVECSDTLGIADDFSGWIGPTALGYYQLNPLEMGADPLSLMFYECEAHNFECCGTFAFYSVYPVIPNELNLYCGAPYPCLDPTGF